MTPEEVVKKNQVIVSKIAECKQCMMLHWVFFAFAAISFICVLFGHHIFLLIEAACLFLMWRLNKKLSRLATEIETMLKEL